MPRGMHYESRHCVAPWPVQRHGCHDLACRPNLACCGQSPKNSSATKTATFRRTTSAQQFCAHSKLGAGTLSTPRRCFEWPQGRVHTNGNRRTATTPSCPAYTDSTFGDSMHDSTRRSLVYNIGAQRSRRNQHRRPSPMPLRTTMLGQPQASQPALTPLVGQRLDAFDTT